MGKIEDECGICCNTIFMKEEYSRDLLFCTLKCMDMFKVHHNYDNNIHHYE